MYVQFIMSCTCQCPYTQLSEVIQSNILEFSVRLGTMEVNVVLDCHFQQIMRPEA